MQQKIICARCKSLDIEIEEFEDVKMTAHKCRDCGYFWGTKYTVTINRNAI